MAEYVRKGGSKHSHKASKGSRPGGGLKSRMPTGVEMSPSGNIGMHRDAELHKVFPGKHHFHSGTSANSAAYLPFTREKQQYDGDEGYQTVMPPRVRRGDKDKV